VNEAVIVKWKEVAPLPVGRTAHTAILLHGSVYVGGGYEGEGVNDYQPCYRVDVYNLITGRWNFSAITTPYCKFAMTVLDDKLVFAGGQTSEEVTNEVLVLNDGEWKIFSEMPTARSSIVAIGYRSMLITVGGTIKVKGKWIRLATTELLDSANGCWYTCADLPVPHNQLKATIINNTLHLLGGNDKDFDPSLQVFTASLDNLSSHQVKWQSLPDTPWCYSAPVVLYNKFLLTVGGRQPFDNTSMTSQVCAFNPSTGLWRHLANIPVARTLTQVVNIADNKIIVLGGTTSTGEYSCNTWIGIIGKPHSQ